MSKFRVGRDLGRWFVHEISDSGAGCDAHNTEAKAVEELRRLQTNELLSAEADLALAKERIKRKRAFLEAAPEIKRMRPVLSDCACPRGAGHLLMCPAA